MAEQIYRYKAFISYRHVDPDRRWAKWLIDSLETYRTPGALVKRGVPSHIGHLFRDDEEIPASSNLSHQIEEALKESQYLIVVCSPNTPKSQWCRHEIDYFRKLGKGDRILALLIEGEPSESFPPELVHVPYEVTQPDGSKTIEMRDEEPIASDIRPREDEPKQVTERRALIRIAATLLGVAFDDLAQRDHQRAVHQQRIIGGAIAAAVLVVAALGIWYWDYSRIKTAYFADVGTRFAEPFGIGTVSADAASHRNGTYEVQSQRGHVVHVRLLNGLGVPIQLGEGGPDPWNQGAAEWRVHYQGDRVGTIDIFTATGQPLRTETYRFFPDGQSGLVAFSRQSGAAAALASNVGDFQTRTSAGSIDRRSDVTQHRLAFTPEGYVARRVFETVWGTPTRDENGTAGRGYVYDGNGQAVSVRPLGATGKPIVAQSGAAEERRIYSPDAVTSRTELRDGRGALLSAIDYTYDTAGNLIDKLWRGPDSKPVLNKADLVAEERNEYDAHGNLVRVRYFDEAGQPTSNALGYAQYTLVRNAQGRAVGQAFFNAAGKPTLNKINVASVRFELDTAGNITSWRNFGLDGRPTVSNEGYATRLARYSGGLRTETRDLDTAGRLTLDSYGLAITRYTYDARGNLVDERYFDTHDRPVNSTGGYNYARAVSTYDDRGNQTSQSYFGADGEPVINGKLQVASIHYAYNEQGYWSEIAFFGTDGKPMLRDGAARLTFENDDHGNTTEEAVYGVSGERVNNSFGYSRFVQVYDGQDNMVEQRFYGPDDQPVMNGYGYAATRTRYDAHGNDVDVVFLDMAGQPVNAADNYARILKAFDSSRRIVEKKFLDAAGRLVLTKQGFAGMRFGFDRWGHQSMVAFFGTDLKPVMSGLGFAMERETYNGRGKVVESAYYDARGALVMVNGYARKTVAYDDANNIIDLAYYGADNRLVMKADTSPFPYAHAHVVFTPAGPTVVLYDANGSVIPLSRVTHRNK